MIHGTRRAAQSLRDAYSSFSEKNSCAILVPFFPAGILRPDDLDSYKLLAYNDIRFDKILLSMIDEVASIYSIQSQKFLLSGFSGGGQFSSRFLLLHPESLLGVVIGAPGQITKPDKSADWPLGIKDLYLVFGEKYKSGPDFDGMAKVRLHFVVGELDNDPKAILGKDGKGRLDKTKALKEELETLGVGIGSELDIVEGVGHSSVETASAVQRFIAAELARNRLL